MSIALANTTFMLAVTVVVQSGIMLNTIGCIGDANLSIFVKVCEVMRKSTLPFLPSYTSHPSSAPTPKTSAATSTLTFINNATFFGSQAMLVAGMLFPIQIAIDGLSDPNLLTLVWKVVVFLVWPVLLLIYLNMEGLPRIIETTNHVLYGGLMNDSPLVGVCAVDNVVQARKWLNKPNVRDQLLAGKPRFWAKNETAEFIDSFLTGRVLTAMEGDDPERTILSFYANSRPNDDEEAA